MVERVPGHAKRPGMERDANALLKPYAVKKRARELDAGGFVRRTPGRKPQEIAGVAPPAISRPAQDGRGIDMRLGEIQAPVGLDDNAIAIGGNPQDRHDMRGELASDA